MSPKFFQSSDFFRSLVSVFSGLLDFILSLAGFFEEKEELVWTCLKFVLFKSGLRGSRKCLSISALAGY